MEHETTGQSIRDLWLVYVHGAMPTAIDALHAATGMLLERLGGIDRYSGVFAGLKACLDAERCAKLESELGDLLSTYVRLAAAIGYCVAVTTPSESDQIAEWPERALAYAGLKQGPSGA